MRKCLIFVLGILLFLNLVSCAPVVKTDLKSLNNNPEAFKGKRVIVMTDIKSIIESPAAYLGKKIELSGYVKLDRFWRINDWSFILKDEAGRQVSCYEQEYRISGWIMPEMALRQAEQKHEKVTVVGKFEKSKKIELDWIEYKGQHFDTDYKPPEIGAPFF